MSLNDNIKKKIFNIRNYVKYLLTDDEEARKDDLYLFSRVCQEYAIENGMDVAEVTKATNLLKDLPNYDTVTRTRQDLQNKFAELQTNDLEVLERRRRYQEIMREFYSNQTTLPGFENPLCEGA